MQPQQFAVNAIWTQVLPPSPRGTFLPCLRSPSSVLVNRVSLASSTAAAVASLCCPSGGDATDSTQKTTKSETNTNSARRKQTKYKLLGSKTEARLRTRSPPNTNKPYFTRDSREKQSVCYIAFSRFLPPVDIQHILCTCLFFIREKICGHNTMSQGCYIVILQTE